jgi:kinesin family protein 15
MSIVEIYNEKVMDLIGGEDRGLKIREHSSIGVFIQNLTKQDLLSIPQVNDLLNRKKKYSHLLFFIYL